MAQKKPQVPGIPEVQNPFAPQPTSNPNNPTPSAATFLPKDLQQQNQTAPPTIDNTQPISDISLAARLARANVVPGQIPDANLANATKNAYIGQVNANAPILQAEQAQRQVEQNIQRNATAINSIGNTAGILPNEDLAGLGKTFLGSLPDTASTILSRAGAGAAGGAIVGSGVGSVVPVVGTAVGAGGGALAGGLAGAAAGLGSVLSNLKDEYRQNVNAAYADYPTSAKNIKAIINGVNKGLIDPIEAVDLYNAELAKIDRAESRLKKLNEHDWLAKAKPELTKIDSFNRVQRESTAIALKAAIANPNPNAFYDIGLVEVSPENN